MKVPIMVAVQVRVARNRKGFIRRLPTELYLRQTVSCGHEDCGCGGEVLGDGTLLVLDLDVARRQVNFLLDSACVDNVVLSSFMLKELRQLDLSCYAKLRALCRGASNERYASALRSERNLSHRRFYPFPNEFFEKTRVPKQDFESSSEWLDRQLYKLVEWFTAHRSLRGITAEVILLTQSDEKKQKALNAGCKAVTVAEWAANREAEFPGCLERLAFVEEQDADACRDSIVYEAHMPLDDVNRRVRAGTLLQGVIRMDRRSCFSGFVTVSSQTEDIRIKGFQNTNRAVNNDVVAIELLQEEEATLAAGQDEFIEDEFIEDENSLGEEEIAAPAAVATPKRLFGRVVSIIKRRWKTYCGTLQPLDDFKKVGVSSAARISRRFIPVDGRVPMITIRTANSHELDKKRIAVMIDEWPRQRKFPTGHWIDILGPVDDLATETEVILRDHDVITRDFANDVLRCLPPSDWSIPPEEIHRREDLRQAPGLTVCSIDPPGCRDIDDALSFRELPDGVWELGVHIADVTHFVKPDTAIDAEAAERCTTVYMVDRRTDMLPSLLTTDLCSLVEKRDRLTFSVFWRVNPSTMEILDFRFAKCVIRSHAALSYAEAQNKIDDTADSTPLTEGIRKLNAMAQVLRANRFEGGALELCSPEVKFALDDGSTDPKDIKIYESYQTNKLVEEFMLLANITVAEKIVEAYPDFAVLRRHPVPKTNELEALKELLQTENKVLDFSSSRALSRSLDLCTKPDDPQFAGIVRMLATRCMNQALYFCSGELEMSLYRHYGLATPIYTHFTSPIRRYADVLVHRFLTAALKLHLLPETCASRQRMKTQCALLSERHRNAQLCSRASTGFFTYLFFRKHGDRIDTGSVLQLKANGLEVLIPRYGIEGFVKLDDDWKYIEERKEFQHASGATLRAFSKVMVEISAVETHFRPSVVMTLKAPHASEADPSLSMQPMNDAVFET
ncbi:MAG: uncharacterized protein KVP18_002374 [Porospora cf. gigantea A]|nr:MAG: hypothetical protein KVP18_002374 [Porospora cf. gigantea A]